MAYIAKCTPPDEMYRQERHTGDKHEMVIEAMEGCQRKHTVSLLRNCPQSGILKMCKGWWSTDASHCHFRMGVCLSTHLKEKFFTRGSRLYSFVAHSAQYCTLQIYYYNYLNILPGNTCHLSNDVVWCQKHKHDADQYVFAASLICVHHCSGQVTQSLRLHLCSSETQKVGQLLLSS